MLKSKLLPALLVLSLMVAMQPAGAVELSPAEAEAESMVAAINGGAGKIGRQADLPSLLSSTDETAYRDAFRAADAGDRTAVDRALAVIQDPLLIGHVLAQRYLSDRHVTADELREWLDRYADLPDADSIYALARQRFDERARSMRTPVHAKQSKSSSSDDDDATWEDFSVDSARDSLTASERRRLHGFKEHFRSLVRNNQRDEAIDSLNSSETHLLDKADIDELKTVLARSYFTEGRDEAAIKWSVDAAERSGDVLPEAHWVAGLALWRSGYKEEATRHFEAVANAHGRSVWLTSAGAYWAARANLASRHPELVNHWLTQASQSPRTFYGQLAQKALGEDVPYYWDSRPFTDQDAEILAKVPATRRALALLQVGETDRAEAEFRQQIPTASPALAQSLLAVAHQVGLPSLTVNVGEQVARQDGRFHDSATYPVPDWQPSNGWQIDRALVLAVIRQESGFNPLDHTGSALGLMQVVPNTARLMGITGKLTDPSVNLEAGQRYLRYLLNDDFFKGNLLFAAAAYNIGPNSVTHWQQTIHHNGDALLFLESIPVRGTRAYVEQVLANFWAYRNRLNQLSPSLDAIAAGDWPQYDGGSSRPIRVSTHTQD